MDGSRYAGIGLGVSHSSGAQFKAPGHLNGNLSGGPQDAATVEEASRPQVAPVPARRRLLGFERFGPGAVRGSIDAAVSYGRIDQTGVPRTASGGAAPLPPDLLTMPRPRGEPPSNRPSPMIWARDDGGVVGLSYKIKP
jgi:hypothetical protein